MVVRTAEGQTVEDWGRLLADLYESHAVRALRFAYLLSGAREVAEDLTQEAFLAAFDRLDTLRDPRALPGDLRTTILNLARAHFRRQRIERLAIARHVRLARPSQEQPPDVGERERLWHALQRLPFRQRAALVLRHYEDLSEKDTARALGTSVSGLKALAFRGTQALRAQLDTQEGSDE